MCLPTYGESQSKRRGNSMRQQYSYNTCWSLSSVHMSLSLICSLLQVLLQDEQRQNASAAEGHPGGPQEQSGVRGDECGPLEQTPNKNTSCTILTLRRRGHCKQRLIFFLNQMSCFNLYARLPLTVG